jgi:hypothetical protein
MAIVFTEAEYNHIRETLRAYVNIGTVASADTRNKIRKNFTDVEFTIAMRSNGTLNIWQVACANINEFIRV